MMEDTVCIEQQGTVEEVIGDKVYVRIRQISACGDCHARSICSMVEMEDKLIEVHEHALNLSAGDAVNIIMKRSMGNKAVLLGYVIPFLLLITILIILTSLVSKEWIAGLASVAMLIPYYFVLYLLRHRLRKTFTFSLRKPV